MSPRAEKLWKQLAPPLDAYGSGAQAAQIWPNIQPDKKSIAVQRLNALLQRVEKCASLIESKQTLTVLSRGPGQRSWHESLRDRATGLRELRGAVLDAETAWRQVQRRRKDKQNPECDSREFVRGLDGSPRNRLKELYLLLEKINKHPSRHGAIPGYFHQVKEKYIRAPYDDARNLCDQYCQRLKKHMALPTDQHGDFDKAAWNTEMEQKSAKGTDREFGRRHPGNVHSAVGKVLAQGVNFTKSSIFRNYI